MKGVEDGGSIRMGEKLKKYAPYLKVLAITSPKMCKAMVQHADAHLLRCLCECAHNILKGNVPLSPPQKKRLARYKKSLRTLLSKKASVKTKKRTLQKGGFVPALLQPLLNSVLKHLLNDN